ncbi:MAG: hypothetical protein II956_01415 [Bacteroidales bacterium]|nr:hypothetical protein [Bacteroidales bacterium]
MGIENEKNTVIALDAEKVCVPEYHGMFKKKNSAIEYVPYPIENHIYMLKQSYRETIVGEILKTKKFGKRPPKFLATFLKNTYGMTLYEMFFRPYYQKFFPDDIKNVLFSETETFFRKTSAKEILLANFNCAGGNSGSNDELPLPQITLTQAFVKVDRNSYTEVLIPDENLKAFRIKCLKPEDSCGKDYNAIVEFVGDVSKEDIEAELLKLPLNPRLICNESENNHNEIQ